MFNISKICEPKILDFFDGKLPEQELDLLAQEGGFVAPNDFPFDRFLQPLRLMRFPREDHYDIEWAIYECGLERWATYSKSVVMYACELYVYCNKLRQWGMNVEGDFLYLVVKREFEKQDDVIPYASHFLTFIEWLQESVTADIGYNDYYLLLSWLLLARLCPDAKSLDLQRTVTDYLLSKNLRRDDIDLLSSSEPSVQKWLFLHKEIPLADAALNKGIERIIIGR